MEHYEADFRHPRSIITINWDKPEAGAGLSLFARWREEISQRTQATFHPLQPAVEIEEKKRPPYLELSSPWDGHL